LEHPEVFPFLFIHFLLLKKKLQNDNDIWVLKEKLKSLKRDLKQWNNKLFRDINRIKSHIISSIKNLDLIDEDIGLDDRVDMTGGDCW